MLKHLKTKFSNENKATFCNKPQVLLQRGQFLISKNNVPFKALFNTEIATMMFYKTLVFQDSYGKQITSTPVQ